MTASRLLSFGLCALSALAPKAIAGTYKYVSLYVPGAAGGSTTLTAIGAENAVIGNYHAHASGVNRAFIWLPGKTTVAQGTYRRVDVPGSTSTNLLGISSRGIAVGTFFAMGKSGQSLFTYDIGTRKFNTAISNRSDLYVENAAINAEGNIVGTIRVGQPSPPRTAAFLARDGVFREIARPVRSATGWGAVAINNANVILGNYIDPYIIGSYTLAGGNLKLLDIPGAIHGTQPTYITPNGTVTGQFYDDKDLATGFAAAGSSVTPYRLNNSVENLVAGLTAGGAIIGTTSSNFTDYRGFVVSSGTYSFMVPPNPNAQVQYITAINSSGSAVVLIHVGGQLFPAAIICTADQIPCTR